LNPVRSGPLTARCLQHSELQSEYRILIYMSNLGETAVVARKVIMYGGISLVVLMIGRVILTGAYSYWRALNPPPPPPPDILWGKLPKLTFPQIAQPEITYRLETKTGGLPRLEDEQYSVFFMPIKKPSLLAYDQAKEIAEKLDYIQTPKQLSATEYRWDKSDPLPSSLTIDIITGQFTLDMDWQDDPTYATPTQYFQGEQAVDQVFNLLSRVDLLPDDIKAGENTITPLKGEGGKLVPAVALAQAHFVQVDLSRSAVEETPVVAARTDKGLITAVLALQRDSDKQFVQLEYNYFPVELETKSVYPIIAVSDAWQRMQSGEGYVANVDSGTTDVVVREVYLAYYDSELPQQYLQPVYVFEGENNYLGFVPAISDQWVE